MSLAHLALTRRIDRLLDPHRGAGPGVTVGVVQEGALVLHRSAGLASVELGVPIGPETRFRVASVSKQFTCAAVLLLAAGGRLAVGDPVRAHLPELPEAYGAITLDQLMHNMSGLRDMLTLMRLGGADLGQPVASADLMAAICRQRGLNFAPGTRYLYCNSGFFLLGRVVEAVSGESLAAFLERRVFGPVGMTRTAHVPGPRIAVAGLATGYVRDGDGWGRAPHGFPIGGEGGLVSCVEDLALWDRELATGQRLGAALGRALAERVAFPDGTACPYARGQRVAPYHGVRTVSHSGLWPGYKTEFLRAPELGVAVIAISNDAGADPNMLAYRVLDMLAEGAPGWRAPEEPGGLEGWAGRYVDEATGVTADADVWEGRPRLRMNGVPMVLEAGEGWFAANRGSTILAARMDGDGLELALDAGHGMRLERVGEGAALPAGLAGAYASEEAGASWIFDGEGGVAWRAEGVAGDCLRVHMPDALFPSWMDVRLVRDSGGRVAGLDVEAGGYGRCATCGGRRRQPRRREPRRGRCPWRCGACRGGGRRCCRWWGLGRGCGRWRRLGRGP